MSVLKPGFNCMGIYEASRTGVIVDAADYYRAFYRTASQARRYIVLTGWQFDSEVRLLRGEDEKEAIGEIGFLKFLEQLCNQNPELEIYILAWDFSAWFSMEREWFQDVIFNWTTNERLHFRFDNVHAAGATHHQKLVIVDGKIAFVGGMDICSARWDDRYHLKENPERMDVDGTVYGSYHDIQSYHTGPAVKDLLEVFLQRWLDSGGAPLTLPVVEQQIYYDDPNVFALPTSKVAVSRTQAAVMATRIPQIHEIRYLFVDAIMSAEKLIYLENQYFSSQAVYWALVARMSAPDRPPLQIVVIVPDRLPFREQLFLGLPQMRMLRSLQEIAEKTGNSLGVYSSALVDEGVRKMTFIHSKVLLIDDRFLTVGSANATNRSMALDTELNVSWEVTDPKGERELVKAIMGLRASLLAEHCGLLGKADQSIFEKIENLTQRLDCLADDVESRLCRYQHDQELENSNFQDALAPVSHVVDPLKPTDGEYVFEALSMFETKSFAKGVLKLGQWIIGMYP
jgi:phospholipase D1/2